LTLVSQNPGLIGVPLGSTVQVRHDPTRYQIFVLGTLTNGVVSSETSLQSTSIAMPGEELTKLCHDNEISPIAITDADYTLTRLSRPLHDAIYCALVTCCDRHTLTILARTAKVIAIHAQPQLYYRIQLRAADFLPTSSRPDCPLPIAPLLRAFALKPERMGSVRHLDLVLPDRHGPRSIATKLLAECGPGLQSVSLKMHRPLSDARIDLFAQWYLLFSPPVVNYQELVRLDLINVPTRILPCILKAIYQMPKLTYCRIDSFTPTRPAIWGWRLYTQLTKPVPQIKQLPPNSQRRGVYTNYIERSRFHVNWS
jgi:hypothetical protein